MFEEYEGFLRKKNDDGCFDECLGGCYQGFLYVITRLLLLGIVIIAIVTVITDIGSCLNFESCDAAIEPITTNFFSMI